MLDAAVKHPAIQESSVPFGFRAIRTTCHDEFQRRADECRSLAAAACSPGDRAFWLGLVERWQVLESRSPHRFLPRRRRREPRGDSQWRP
jgi:hypothetical protein